MVDGPRDQTRPTRDAAVRAAVARELADQGPALVVLTQGGAGVLAVRPNPPAEPLRKHIPPIPVLVADTVGAGDAFSAGLLAALFERNVTDRAALADRIAAQVATR